MVVGSVNYKSIPNSDVFRHSSGRVKGCLVTVA